MQLMTSKYPNKAIVAYVTIMSTDPHPKAIVGGIKNQKLILQNVYQSFCCEKMSH
jgi:hypothetical protein